MDVVQLTLGAGVVVAVVAFVAWPMITGGPKHATGAGVTLDEARIERRITEYREALRRRTVCETCLYANVAGARWARRLPRRLTP